MLCAEQDEDSALMVAVDKCQKAAAKLLIDASADLNLQNKVNPKPSSPKS